ncbi:MAG: hypothetical protein J0L54_04600 [Chitinophagales bacterium]|nr:hypothetical protein [Chitinophagales bacterium]
MKKIILTILSICFLFTATAQIISNLVLMAKPPAQLSEWGSRREVLTLILNGQGVPVTQFKIKAEIKTTDGTVVGSVDLARAAVLTGNQAGGPTILFASDVLPLEYMNFTGKYKSALQKTGKLPADNYTLCTRPVRPADYAPLGEEQCKPFYLASLQLPILMKPYNEELLDPKKAQTAILFRWSPVVPAQTSPVTYRIQVFEVLNNQSPVQALRSNQPLLDKELLAVTQYIWQPQLTFVNEKSKFIWTIQSLDKDQKPITQTDGNGEARSEPIVFYIGTSTKHD